MTAFDPRVTPARHDLAARHLEGKVEAARFVDGVVREVIDPQAPLRHEPWPDAPLATEALMGERATIYDETEGWCWGQLAADGYVGWLPANALAQPGPEPTHRVAALRTLAFPGRSIKVPPVAALSFGCRLAVARLDGHLAVTAAGYVPARHLVPIDSAEADFVAIAERFIGTPYLWGGRTSLGLDCSGLVQLALAAAGHPCPRDADMQQALGEEVDRSNIRRGDLVFWQGHVAIVRDPTTLLHANAFHMAVALEPLSEAVARIAATGSEVTGVRRIAPEPVGG